MPWHCCVLTLTPFLFVYASPPPPLLTNEHPKSGRSAHSMCQNAICVLCAMCACFVLCPCFPFGGSCPYKSKGTKTFSKTAKKPPFYVLGFGGKTRLAFVVAWATNVFLSRCHADPTLIAPLYVALTFLTSPCFLLQLRSQASVSVSQQPNSLDRGMFCTVPPSSAATAHGVWHSEKLRQPVRPRLVLLLALGLFLNAAPGSAELKSTYTVGVMNNKGKMLLRVKVDCRQFHSPPTNRCFFACALVFGSVFVVSKVSSSLRSTSSMGSPLTSRRLLDASLIHTLPLRPYPLTLGTLSRRV